MSRTLTGSTGNGIDPNAQIFIVNSTDANSGGSGAINVQGGIYVGKTTFTNDLVVQDTLDSTSIGNGSITTAGGLGVQKTIWATTLKSFASTVCGTDLNVFGFGKFQYNIDATSKSAAGVTTTGGLGVAKTLWANAIKTDANATIGGTFGAGATTITTLSSTDTTDSTSTTTGSVQILGGLGIKNTLWTQTFNSAGNSSVGGTLGVTGATTLGGTTAAATSVTTLITNDATDATTTTSGSVQMLGGLGVKKTLWVQTLKAAGNANITGTLGAGATSITTLMCSDVTDATSTTSGSVQLLGGLGVKKTLWAQTLNSGAATVTTLVSNDPTDSTSGGLGAVQLSGGLYVAKTIFGQTINCLGTSSSTAGKITGTTDSTSGTTGSFWTQGGLGVSLTMWCNALKVATSSILLGTLSVASTSTFTGKITASAGIQATSGTSSITSAVVTYFYTIPNLSRGFVTVTSNITTPAMIMGFFERSDGTTFPSINILANSGSSFAASGLGGTQELHMQVNTGNQIGVYTTSSGSSTCSYYITLL